MRPRGRQKATWEDEVMEDIKILDIKIQRWKEQLKDWKKCQKTAATMNRGRS